MQSALQPYATAGVAIVGAGLVAVTPVAAPLSDIVTARDVALTADGNPFEDLLGPFTSVFNTASDNATTLANNFFLAPGVALQQLSKNMNDFLTELAKDPTSSNSVAEQMQAHLDAVLTGYTLQNSGPFEIGSSSSTTDLVVQHTLSGTDASSSPPVFGHDLLFFLLPQLLPASDAKFITPIVDFLASPASGILLGQLGPALAPWVALSDSISDHDSFTQTLANMLGAFLNGTDINLDSLIPTIEKLAPPSPLGPLDITHLDFALPGLLSTGDVAVGPYELADGSSNIVASVPAVGGSILNSLGISLSALGLNVDIASHAVGPIGASEAWGQTVGALLGSGWDGKGPVVVTPPGPGITLPLQPTDTGIGDVGAAGAGDAGNDLSSTLSQLATDLGINI